MIPWTFAPEKCQIIAPQFRSRLQGRPGPLRQYRQRHQQAGHDPVQPEVISGHHHGQCRHHGIAQCEPPPLAPRDTDHGDCDDNRPSHVHRRHRRVLVRFQRAVAPGVDRLPVPERGVDQPGTGQQSRRGHRDQLNEQACRGEHHQDGPDPRIVPAVPPVHPDQAADQHREMQHVVVQVERLHQQRMRQERPLHRRLARQVQHPLQVPEPPSPGRPASRAHDAERPRELPQRVQSEQHARLDQRRRYPPRAAEQPDGHQAASDDRRVRPGKHEVRHAPISPNRPGYSEKTIIRNPPAVSRSGGGQTCLTPRLRGPPPACGSPC
jgi:hypothetical protein